MIFLEMNNDQFKEYFENMLEAMGLKHCQITNCMNKPEINIQISIRNAYPVKYEEPWGLEFSICKNHVGLFHRVVKSITDIPIV